MTLDRNKKYTAAGVEWQCSYGNYKWIDEWMEQCIDESTLKLLNPIQVEEMETITNTITATFDKKGNCAALSEGHNGCTHTGDFVRQIMFGDGFDRAPVKNATAVITVELTRPKLDVIEKKLGITPEPKTWKRWRAENGGKYWTWMFGEPAQMIERGDKYSDIYYNEGNYHQTKEQAIAYGMRQRSMVPTCPMPKYMDKVWIVDIFGCQTSRTTFSKYFTSWYHLGRVHLTEESARAWLDEFAKYWEEV